MEITRLRANHYENPMGYDLENLSLSWVAESEKAKKQEWARVKIGTRPDLRSDCILFDSGRKVDADSLSYQPDLLLVPRTRYYWNVEVQGDNGENAVSETAFFETGKMKEGWKGSWITANLPADVHPYFRKGFTLDVPAEEIVSARVYACAAGIYELYVNGEKASDEYLLPGSHAYDYWMQYQTFDVTKQLVAGENVIGAMVGKGWFSGRFALGDTKNDYGDRMAFLCELVIAKKDGSCQVIATDTSWLSHGGPVTDSSIYDGEYYDARLEIADWCGSGCDTSGWAGTEPIELKIGPMAERLSPPIEKQEAKKPVKVIGTPKQETVLDFGQNMTGWVEFTAELPEGSRVFLQYGEILQDECFYNENLRSAKAEFEYLSDGKKAQVRPHFTFYGFRYVKVTITAPDGTAGNALQAGEGEINPEDFTAWVIHSTMTDTAQVETSDERVNQLIRNAKWGQRGNFLDVPTDCPQRDERMGWTGDAQIFCGTASFFTDTAGFYGKYMRDTREEQMRIHGSVPFVVPCPKVGGVGEGNGSCAWADVATVIPWTLYLYFGDKSLLGKQYGTMKDWVEYIRSKDEEDGGRRLWQTGFHFADWLALDNYKDPQSSMGGTDCYYIASAYYYYSTKLTADAAEVLGNAADASKYRRLQSEIRDAFRKEYFTPNGRIAEQTQTAHVVALFFGLLPEEQRARALETLKRMIKENGMHLNTGFVGTPYLCRALSEGGANDYAYQLLMKDDFPSWLYEVKMGATTVWERWNSVMPDGHLSGTGMNSLNHYAYGSVAEWIMRDICGINPVFGRPGFRKAVIKPQPYSLLKHAVMTYDSPCGRYVSGWKFEEDDMLTYTVTVPFGCEAELRLPAEGEAKFTVNGKEEVWDCPDGRIAVKEVEAGSYTITGKAPEFCFRSLSLESTLADVLADEGGKKALAACLPQTVSMLEAGAIPMEMVGEQPVRELLKMGAWMGAGASFCEEQAELLERELKKCR